MTKGNVTINKNGSRNVTPSGNLDVAGENLHGSCCCCKPYTLATFTASDYATWNLSQYQGDGVAEPYRYWRLVNNYMSYVPQRQGCVDKNGKLVDLPSSISTTTYKYTWYFRLEIGCKDETGNYIKWPDGTTSYGYQC